ncbi:MAG TPA: SARP family transcriptional regulator [Microbacteriaceae bacterium]|jgi:DNA-binding SARP family transcriptional activator|nr:SARP family transcriptional regulator [Microbacteriaceae bacterium]
MASENNRWQLTLLGHWQLRRDGEPVFVAVRQRRLLAALAIFGARSRRFLAGTLWPDGGETRAAGSLRACVWHVRHETPNLIDEAGDELFLDESVEVDLHDLQRRLLLIDDEESTAVMLDDLAALWQADLLPGWYEAWVISEQERVQQWRLGALETLAARFLDVDRIDYAVTAATMAASIDPLRESAHRLVIQGHVMAGNDGAALREYQAFRARLSRELGVAPSTMMQRLVATLDAKTTDRREAAVTSASRR